MSALVGKLDTPPVVKWLDQRKHLAAVMDLEASAARDHRRIYEGSEWTVGGFREFLRGGAGLVALNANGTVVGFSVYTPRGREIHVAKIVAQSRAAENALLAALWTTLKNNAKEFMSLPLVLELD